MNRLQPIQTKAEDSPRRYEKLYLMLLEAIPSSVLMVDHNMSIIFANRNFLEKSRRSMDDTVGHSIEEIFPETILDHMKLNRQIALVFEKNQSTEGRRLSYRAPGVPLRIYYYRLLPFAWEGIVESVMLLMNDVTEQTRLSEEVRRVERHLASVVDRGAEPIPAISCIKEFSTVGIVSLFGVTPTLVLRTANWLRMEMININFPSKPAKIRDLHGLNISCNHQLGSLLKNCNGL